MLLLSQLMSSDIADIKRNDKNIERSKSNVFIEKKNDSEKNFLTQSVIFCLVFFLLFLRTEQLTLFGNKQIGHMTVSWPNSIFGHFIATRISYNLANCHNGYFVAIINRPGTWDSGLY